MFVQLIGISGVGAATARMMLSSLKPDEISRAIVQGNVKLLEGVKGIGKKTAERLVLELKDKISKYAATEVDKNIITGNLIQQDAFNALAALGISRQQAEGAVQKIILSEPHITNLEELIKKALKII
ncbi:MAG: Holliday junction branch migration protein RuvA [Ferruginibacter sp.]